MTPEALKNLFGYGFGALAVGFGGLASWGRVPSVVTGGEAMAVTFELMEATKDNVDHVVHFYKQGSYLVFSSKMDWRIRVGVGMLSAACGRVAYGLLT